jgi:hypothetical protein
LLAGRQKKKGLPFHPSALTQMEMKEFIDPTGANKIGQHEVGSTPDETRLNKVPK